MAKKKVVPSPLNESQLALVDGKALTEHDVMEAMELVVQELYRTQDVDHAANVLEIMNRIENVSGHAKAKLLWGMNEWWKETGQSNKRDVEFTDYVEDKGILTKTVVDRYVTIQSHIEDLSIPKEFHTRPLRELNPIARALEQGYEISKATWSKLRAAPNQSEVGRIIREDVKQKKARKNAKRIVWKRTGDLVGYKGEQMRHLGYLDRKGYDNDTLSHQLIDEIIEKIGAKIE